MYIIFGKEILIHYNDGSLETYGPYDSTHKCLNDVPLKNLSNNSRDNLLREIKINCVRKGYHYFYLENRKLVIVDIKSIVFNDFNLDGVVFSNEIIPIIKSLIRDHKLDLLFK